MKIKIIALLCVTLMLASCHSKEDYLEEFKNFVDEVELNYTSFDEEKWKESDEKFEELSDKEFNDYKDELTDDELHTIDQFDAIYMAIKVKMEAKRNLGR